MNPLSSDGKSPSGPSEYYWEVLQHGYNKCNEEAGIESTKMVVFKRHIRTPVGYKTSSPTPPASPSTWPSVGAATVPNQESGGTTTGAAAAAAAAKATTKTAKTMHRAASPPRRASARIASKTAAKVVGAPAKDKESAETCNESSPLSTSGAGEKRRCGSSPTPPLTEPDAGLSLSGASSQSASVAHGTTVPSTPGVSRTAPVAFDAPACSTRSRKRMRTHGPEADRETDSSPPTSAPRTSGASADVGARAGLFYGPWGAVRALNGGAGYRGTPIKAMLARHAALYEGLEDVFARPGIMDLATGLRFDSHAQAKAWYEARSGRLER